MHISWSTDPATLIWVSLERSFLSAELWTILTKGDDVRGGKRASAHHETLLRIIGSVNLESSRVQNMLITTYKTLYDIAPPYLKLLLKERKVAYNLRGTQKLNLPRVTTTTYVLHSFRYIMLKEIFNKTRQLFLKAHIDVPFCYKIISSANHELPNKIMHKIVWNCKGITFHLA